jgi:hypothetical protein
MVMADVRNLAGGGRPFPRSDVAPVFRRDAPPGNSFLRFITASAIAAMQKAEAVDVAAGLWPTDRDVIELTRAVSAPTMTSIAGWAMELAHKVVVDALDALGPASAAADVIRRGLVFSFDGAGQIAAPGFTVGAGNASFVAEGQPIPVRQLASAAALLNPFKLAAISALTQELINSSNAEAAIRDALIRAMGAALDAAFFDANAATAARPAGIRNGIVALTPSPAADLWEAAAEDIATLISAIASVAGTGPYIIVGSPGRAVGLGLRFAGTTTATIFGSSAVGNDLLAVAPAALVAALSPMPDVESATAATLVMDDTAPGLPGTTGSPEKSVFQTSSVAIKVRWPITWALRNPAGVAWLTPSWK